nr:hypothetical protein Cduv_348 [Cedratvirus duvanny]
MEEETTPLALPEIKERVLLFLSLPDLLSQCSLNQSNRQICSSRGFWVEKFRQEGLSLLESGQSVQEWVAIYTNSLLARDVTDLYVEKLQEKSCSFPLSAVQDINLLLIGDISREELSPYYFSNRLWKTKDYLYAEFADLTLSGAKNTETIKWLHVYRGIKDTAAYIVSLLPKSHRFLISHVKIIDIPPHDERYNPEDPGGNWYKEREIVLDVSLSPADLKKLVYRLVYFNVNLVHMPNI